MKHTLFLGSKSPSRQHLLKDAHIPFTLASQDADESQCDWGLPLKQLVTTLSLYKMQHVVLPDGKEGDVCFVVTADTLSQDIDGTIEGKPVDTVDAIRKIKNARKGTRLATAFCVDKKMWHDGAWCVEQRVAQCITASYLFSIPDEWIDIYLETSTGLNCSNAIAIEGYGDQFLKKIDGSYSTIVGLPMFELREALTKLGFFF